MRPLGVQTDPDTYSGKDAGNETTIVSWHRSHNCCLFFSTYAPFLLSPSFFSMKLLSWGSSPVFGSKSTFFLIQGSLIATIISWSIFISNRPIGSFGSQLTTWSLAAVYNTICCSRLRFEWWKKKENGKKPFCFHVHSVLLGTSRNSRHLHGKRIYLSTAPCGYNNWLVGSRRILLQSKITRNQGTESNAEPWK